MESKMIKVGLDLHGVIDKDPEFFAGLSNELLLGGNEVYVITGQEINDDLFTQLENCGMMKDKWKLFNDIISVTTYRKEQGVEIWYLDDEKTQPMMNEHTWNTSKALICSEYDIDIMIDDSKNYESFFWDIKTRYIVYDEPIRKMLKTIFYNRGK